MMYPFMTLEDGTEVVHSEVRDNGTIKVNFEKPTIGGFYSAFCVLPQFTWNEVDGFSSGDIDRFQNFLKAAAQLISERTQQMR